jgi:hypothetical protein
MNEGSVLKPTPKNQKSDDWSCFVLRDAVVYHQDRQRLANPLLVQDQGPFIIRGKLEVAEKEQGRRKFLGCHTLQDSKI